MYAAVKLIVGIVIACGSLIAAILESERHAFIVCLCAGFVLGASIGELVRGRLRQVVRSAPTTWSRAQLVSSRGRKLP